MVVETEIPVRYAETDAMGVVYHANYLLPAPTFLRKSGIPMRALSLKGSCLLWLTYI